MITKKDVKIYNQNVGKLDEKDIPVLNQLLKEKKEINKSRRDFEKKYDALSMDLQLAFKIFMMEK